MDIRFTYIVSFYLPSSVGRELLPDDRGGEYSQEIKYPIRVPTVADLTPKPVHSGYTATALKGGWLSMGLSWFGSFFLLCTIEYGCSLSQE